MSSIIDDLKRNYQFGGLPQKLIFWNIVCFIVSYVLFGLLRIFSIEINALEYVSLSSDPKDLFWKPWSFLSYAFFHFDFVHILFNLLVLNFTSQLFLTFFNQKQLLGLYLIAAVFSGVLFLSIFYLIGRTSSIVGASGAIMAVLAATATYRPMMNVRLLLVGNIQLWQIAAAILLLDLAQVMIENSGGHIAHLAGAVFGFIYIKLLENGTDLSIYISKTIDFFVNLTKKQSGTPFKKIHKSYQNPPKNASSRIVTKDKTQQQIDEILDKISRSGYDSLSKEEKEFLFKVGKQ